MGRDFSPLFNRLDGYDATKGVPLRSIEAKLRDQGVHDALVKNILAYLRDACVDGVLPPAQFSRVVECESECLEKALAGKLAIPDWAKFSATMEDMFEATRKNDSGANATCIPSLEKQDASWWGLAVCTVDGQQLVLGDYDVMYTLQSTVKPLTYALALLENGEEQCNEHVGHEPSGQAFNAVVLDSRCRPHNPMINAGAMMTCSLVKRDRQSEPAERFDYVLDVVNRLAGSSMRGTAKCTFDNSTYLSELRHADRNFCLAYLMMDSGAFPEKTDINKTLEFYFQCCSITTDARNQAVIAASLAKGGVNPLTGSRVLPASAARNALSVMYTCGMYDYSGEFAFAVGLPAKSGVAGAVMISIPNVMGICTFSPRLDGKGNSARGVDFCRRLVQRYNFHVFDGLHGLSPKDDPRYYPAKGVSTNDACEMCFAAAAGDVSALRELVSIGVSPTSSDYDRRTPLHLAATEGKLDAVKFLVAQGACKDAKDRWGATPFDDATKGKHDDVAEFLKAA